MGIATCGVPAAPVSMRSLELRGSEFVYDRAPFPSAHASTLVQAADALVAAWFGGTQEGHPDVGIWVSRRDASGWSTPVEVANGVQPNGTRLPCWNPVLFQPSSGLLVLFYKVGSSPATWWGIARTSSDEGRTWSAAVRLPEGILGPIRAKPVEIEGGVMLAGSSTEHDGWIVYMERYSGDWTRESLASPATWWRSAPLNTKEEFGAIQPTILLHSSTRLQVLCRSRQKVITEALSEDGGNTWTRMRPTTLPNPSAGIDSVRLRDGRFLLAYNPSAEDRRRLEIASSLDGKTWQREISLEDADSGEYSYPAMIQTREGNVHITYTWRRERLRHAVIALR